MPTIDDTTVFIVMTTYFIAIQILAISNYCELKKLIKLAILNNFELKELIKKELASKNSG